MKTFEEIAKEILTSESFNDLIITIYQYTDCFDTLLQIFNKYFEIKETNGKWKVIITKLLQNQW